VNVMEDVNEAGGRQRIAEQADAAGPAAPDPGLCWGAQSGFFGSS
jgi:hypothetical protein